MKTLVCDCNRTLPVDRPALAQALARTPGASEAGVGTPLSLLCRREAPEFQRAARETAASGEPLLVGCTQESVLFVELNDQTEGTRPVDERPIRFVNLRETGGWSRDARGATPKLAALIAAAQLPDPEPVATVSYASGGRCLVIGPADRAEAAAALLAEAGGAGDGLQPVLLVDRPGGALGQARRHPVLAGRLQSLTGHLGAFQARWVSENPIDLELCTRCNACIDACPEGAIDFSYQVDLAACQGHRACVKVCEAAGAIDFERGPLAGEDRFDLVLDLRETPHFSQHQRPQGYLHVGHDERRLMQAVLTLRGLVGEFEKPRFFHYRESLCAHSRNQQTGCDACIEVCSARAIRSDALLKGKRTGKHRGAMPGAPDPGAPRGQGGGVVVDPHLCAGCGACSTVCPTGAMRYGYPGPVDQGRRLHTMLAAYAQAGGRDAVLLLHSQDAGARLIDELGRGARTSRGSPLDAGGLHGMPARVIPVPLWHTASVGLDLWLSAKAHGASQIWLLLTDEEAPEYRQALAEQVAVAQALLAGLGYAGEHLRLIEARDARDLPALDAALRAPPAQGVSQAARFAVQADKRGTLELALEHLATHAPLPRRQQPEVIPLPAAGAPFGGLTVDTGACTMCLSCVGACPAAALQDNPERPQLRFIEKNCVQCGLCVGTCPESALTLDPRWWGADEGRARRNARVLHEVEPFGCVRCGKPFGTLRAVEAMVAKLAHHPAFAGAAAERLRMCGDCRVIDLHTQPTELRITDL